LPAILRKYDDLSSIDNIHAAIKKADEVQDIMSQNIRNMVNNMQNVEVVWFLF